MDYVYEWETVLIVKLLSKASCYIRVCISYSSVEFPDVYLLHISSNLSLPYLVWVYINLVILDLSTFRHMPYSIASHLLGYAFWKKVKIIKCIAPEHNSPEL